MNLQKYAAINITINPSSNHSADHIVTTSRVVINRLPTVPVTEQYRKEKLETQ
jgi:hypothetical protein